MKPDEYTVPVDEYIRRELGWQDIVDEDSDAADIDGIELMYARPVSEYCDGPYQSIGYGCSRRLPCGGMDDE